MCIFISSRAYQYLKEAAEMNHTKSMELVAEASLYGEYLPQNVSEARRLYSTLGMNGSTAGQMVS